jgi:hypothetical protein
MMATLPKGSKPLVPGDELVEVQHGPGAKTLLRFRDTGNEHFVFAQFQDNQPYQNMAHDDWQHHVTGALERFLATRGLSSMGIKHASTSPYDFLVEFS